MKPRPPSNPQTLDCLMLMAVDFAGFSLRGGRQIPPTLLAVTKKRSLFFNPAALQDARSKDDFADTSRLICIAYQVPAAVMILESWMRMAAEREIPLPRFHCSRQHRWCHGKSYPSGLDTRTAGH